VSEERDALDRFYTPLSLARAIAKQAFQFAPLARRFLEPSCGSGNFITGLKGAWQLPVAGLQVAGWALEAVDLDPAARASAEPLGANFFNEDFLEWSEPYDYDVVIGNPPFAKPPAEGKKRGEVIAQKHVERMLSLLEVGGVCAVLLRSSFTSSKERYPLFESHPPVLVQQIVERPSFTDDGATDQHEYSAFYWRRMSRLSFGDPGQTRLEWLSWK
jgi:hypothetical protein